MTWIIDGDEVYVDGVKAIENGYSYVSPYPPMWLTDGKEVYYKGMPKAIENGYSFVNPFPPMWLTDRKEVYYKDMPVAKEIGAFNGCYLCEEVVIPESVKTIGPYAFAGSGISEVTIAEDCKYFPTSFPKGCRIKRY